MYLSDAGMTPNRTCTCPLIRSGRRERLAAVRNVDHVDAGHHLEQLPGDMERAPIAARRHVDLARIGLGVADEFRDRLGWNRWIDHHDIKGAANARDRRESFRGWSERRAWIENL